MRALFHPDRDQLRLTDVLDSLSDPTRLAIAAKLASCGEAACGHFEAFGAKPNLTYHFTRLREAGVIRVRQEGTSRLITLRIDDLAERFPGLLNAILQAARDEAERQENEPTQPMRA